MTGRNGSVFQELYSRARKIKSVTNCQFCLSRLNLKGKFYLLKDTLKSYDQVFDLYQLTSKN